MWVGSKAGDVLVEVRVLVLGVVDEQIDQRVDALAWIVAPAQVGGIDGARLAA